MINASDASNAIEFFESAVRGHENMGSQHPSDWPVVEEDLKNARAGVNEMLNSISILDRLKEWIEVEKKRAQRAIVSSGYSYEHSHRTDVLCEVLSQIEQFDQNPRPPAEPSILP